MKTMRTIYLDMDGTFVNLYGVENWLPMLRAENTLPYEIAKPLVNFSYMARLLNQAQKCGYRIGIISWLCKGGSKEYNKAVEQVKVEYLRKHLPSVQFDEINILPYGIDKGFFNNGNDILIDDEEKNRVDWNGEAYRAENLLAVLKEIVRG